MKALRTLTPYGPGLLMNPGFRYRDSRHTDVARTFARVRREQQARAAQPPAQLALTMPDATTETTTATNC